MGVAGNIPASSSRFLATASSFRMSSRCPCFFSDDARLASSPVRSQKFCK